MVLLLPTTQIWPDVSFYNIFHHIQVNTPLYDSVLYPYYLFCLSLDNLFFDKYFAQGLSREDAPRSVRVTKSGMPQLPHLFTYSIQSIQLISLFLIVNTSFSNDVPNPPIKRVQILSSAFKFLMQFWAKVDVKLGVSEKKQIDM